MREDIRFGTDGWRAMIAKSFTFRNVQIFAHAVADYVLDHFPENKSIIIGYDNRFLAEQFALEMSCVLNSKGIRVYFTDKAVPVPSVTFSVLNRKTAGGLMITASSLSYQYCGVKFIPCYAGPADEKTVSILEKRVKELDKDYIYDSEISNCPDLFEKFDPVEDYLDFVKTFIDLDRIQEAQLNVVVNPMYGTGRGCLESILEGVCSQLIVINDQIDCLFGGINPDPVEDNLREDKRIVLENGFDIALSLDGDADRVGVIDRNGKFITPNQVVTLLLHHLVTNRGFCGKVVKSVSTTRMLDRLCEVLDLELEQTPVGFKYISEKMRESEVIIGGEESGGISIKGYFPAKDGILAALLLVEMVAQERRSISEILDEIQSKTGYFFSRRMDLDLDGKEKSVLEYLLKGYELNLSGRMIPGKRVFDGQLYELSDNAWIYIRQSGTRGILRIYLETSDILELDNLESELKKVVDKIICSEVCV